MEKKCLNCGKELVEITNKCCSSGAVHEYPTGEYKCVNCDQVVKQKGEQ